MVWLLCSPTMNPSTTSLALNSKELSFEIMEGFKYFDNHCLVESSFFEFVSFEIFLPEKDLYYSTPLY